MMIDDNQVNSCVQSTNSFDGKRLKRILNAFGSNNINDGGASTYLDLLSRL